jgi:hypothetical protein
MLGYLAVGLATITCAIVIGLRLTAPWRKLIRWRTLIEKAWRGLPHDLDTVGNLQLAQAPAKWEPMLSQPTRQPECSACNSMSHRCWEREVSLTHPEEPQRDRCPIVSAP